MRIKLSFQIDDLPERHFCVETNGATNQQAYKTAIFLFRNELGGELGIDEVADAIKREQGR